MMNSEIALNQIGQTLMKGRDNTPLGVRGEYGKGYAGLS